MYLSKEIKDNLDEHLRLTSPRHAEMLIKESRKIQVYEIVAKRYLPNKTEKYGVSTLEWHVIKTILCDLRDAVTFTEEVADSLGVPPCHLFARPQQDDSQL